MNLAINFVRQTYGGIRRTVTRDARGRVEVTETPFSFTGHCYPSGQLMGQMEPSGRALEGAYAVLTEHELNVDDEAAGTVGDDILIGGRRYRIKAVTDRSSNPVAFLRHRSYVANYVRSGTDGA